MSRMGESHGQYMIEHLERSWADVRQHGCLARITPRDFVESLFDRLERCPGAHQRGALLMALKTFVGHHPEFAQFEGRVDAAIRGFLNPESE